MLTLFKTWSMYPPPEVWFSICVFLGSVFVSLVSFHHRVNYTDFIVLFSLFLILWHLWPHWHKPPWAVFLEKAIGLRKHVFLVHTNQSWVCTYQLNPDWAQYLNLVWHFVNHCDCSPPGSSAHGISQVVILEWISISTSTVSSRPRDRTHISCIGSRHLYHWATWEALS